MKNLIKISILVLISFLAMSTVAMAKPNPEQKKVLVMINAKRAKKSAAPLRWHRRLEKSSRKHSKDMVANDYMAHTSPSGLTLGSRLKKAGVLKWDVTAEVYVSASTPRKAVDKWLDRRGNKRKLMNSGFSHVGVGIVKGGDNGKTYTINLVSKPKFKRSIAWQSASILKTLNAKRHELGLQPVRWNWKLERAGRLHSKDMLTNNYFSHTSRDGRSLVDRLTESNVTGWRRAGENIVGTSSPARAFELWMQSDSHRRNMLRAEYTHVGIGMALDGQYMVFTMNLAQY